MFIFSTLLFVITCPVTTGWNPQMIMRAGCTTGRGDFMCSYLCAGLRLLFLFAKWNPQMIIDAGCKPVRGDFMWVMFDEVEKTS
jgi:hypothetical protein